MENKNVDIKKLLEIMNSQSEDMKRAVEFTSNQTKAVYEIYKNMEENNKNMIIFEKKMDLFSEKMDKLEDKMDNYVFLMPSECSFMSDLVRANAIKISDRLNYINYYPSAKNFGAIVGRVMTGIRAMLRAKFKAPRWYMIKHVDYDDAMEYLSTITSSEFLAYRSARDVKKPKTNSKEKLKLVK